jgi:hypothetical protein
VGKRIFAPELDHSSIRDNVPLRDLLRRIIEFAQRQSDLSEDVAAALTTVGGDTTTPPVSTFTATFPGDGTIHLSSIAFALKENVHSIDTGYFVFDFVNAIAPTATTLNGAITEAATTIIVSGFAGFAPGDSVLIGSEVIRIDAMAGTTWTVTRGWLESSRASHLTLAAVERIETPHVEVYTFPPDFFIEPISGFWNARVILPNAKVATIYANFFNSHGQGETATFNQYGGQATGSLGSCGGYAPFPRLWGWDWTLSPYLSDLAVFKSSGTNPLIACAEVWKPGLIDNVGIHTAGGGYTVNDWLTIVQAGASNGIVRVSTIGGGGTVTAVEMVNGGENYSVAAGLSTTGGTGTGCKISIGGTAYDLNTDNYLPRLRFFNPYNSAAVLRLMLLSAVSVTPAANHLLFLDLDFQLINNIAAGSGIVIAQVGSETDVFYLIEVYRATSSCALLKRTGGAYQTQFSSAGYSSHYQWVNVKIIYNPNAGAIGGISPGGVLVYNAGQPLFKKPMTLTNATVLSGPVRVGWLIPGAAGARANEIRLGRIEAYSVPADFIQLLP